MDKYTPQEFISEMKLEITHNEISFIENMQHLEIKSRTFPEWIGIFVAWMEWLPEDYNRIYGDN